jgi:septum formation protein
MEFLKKYNIILASKSPRRRQLLEEMDIIFEVKTRDVDEDFPDDLEKEKVAIFLCEKKAEAFTANQIGDNDLIITADTIVCLEGDILNKPGDREHAIEMLQNLSGKKHEVITGVCLRSRDKQQSFFVSTDVYFKSLSPEEIEYYVDHYRPFDKAGSYGIQEWIGHIGIGKIEGSYFNVMGLPTARLYQELKAFLLP